MDATWTQYYIANLKKLDGKNLLCSDVNYDGVVSILDTTTIQKQLAHII